MVKTVISASLLFLLAADFVWASEKMVLIPAGSYPQFFKSKDARAVSVTAFWLDPQPVTKEQFLKFLKNQSEWRKSKVKKIFADSHYLKDWKSDLNFGPADKRSPVTFISWFAAQAYCRAQGKELPTTDQWEYAGFDQGRGKSESTKKILDWYSRPSEKIPEVGKSSKNGFGAYDLFGLVWEWTLDFNGNMVGDEGRANGRSDNNLFCGGAALAAADPSDYASYMRFAFRGSLQAKYSVNNLGFRCAKPEEEK